MSYSDKRKLLYVELGLSVDEIAALSRHERFLEWVHEAAETVYRYRGAIELIEQIPF